MVAPITAISPFTLVIFLPFTFLMVKPSFALLSTAPTKSLFALLLGTYT